MCPDVLSWRLVAGIGGMCLHSRAQAPFSPHAPMLLPFFSIPVDWRLFSLQLLSKTTTVLVSQVPGDSEEEASCDSDSSFLAIIRDELLPQ